MSKTLSLKKDISGVAPAPGPVETEKQVKAFTAAELRAMLAQLEPNGVQMDPTMNLPISPTDPAEMAAKAALPPAGERKAGAAPQLPPAVHGSFSLNGIPLIAPGVNLGEHINPSTGLPYVQVTSPSRGGCISPPPSRNFR